MPPTDALLTLDGLGAKPHIYQIDRQLAQEVRDFIEARVGGSVSIDDVFPDWNHPQSAPAAILRGMRLRQGLTQKQLASAIDIRQHHLSEMENGKRGISKEMAHKLGKALQTDYRVFL